MRTYFDEPMYRCDDEQPPNQPPAIGPASPKPAPNPKKHGEGEQSEEDEQEKEPVG